ncbi:MAG: hypothetical protein WAW42_13460 [Candidatus Competibacteraceae bacterium]
MGLKAQVVLLDALIQPVYLAEQVSDHEVGPTGQGYLPSDGVFRGCSLPFG